MTIKYFHIENFLDAETTDSLIYDLNKYVPQERVTKYFGGRYLLPNTDDKFDLLIQESISWKLLYERVNSNNFINLCLDNLGISSNKFIVKKYFTKHKSIYRRFAHKYAKRFVVHTSILGLLAYIIYRSYKLFFQKIFFLPYKLTNKIPVELLFDVSRAANGYSREIHRDSDSRAIVFLIYLNDLDSDGEGGELNLYEYCGAEKGDPPPTPEESVCKLLQSIEPRRGSLVAFENGNDSFHGVPLMSGYSSSRYFCYGSATVLNGKSPFLLKSKYELGTEFQMYI